ncbi:C1 family peptidase [Malacoplasma iowae]|uniref:C1 family peptidase n=1 Tax=Malacoplasma iowae TaxID=2116 RepID=UPI002A18A2C4|nr:C1 family peptidase [Malacoplasma iowae]WPL39671.1 C1 family peptidase [Malacoplasma iowae]
MRIKSINEKLIDKISSNHENNKLVRNALVKNSIYSVALSPNNQIKNTFNFSIDINTLPAVDQKMSGRCWIYAATNLIRENIAKNLHLDNFELSQSYLAFWDKFERCNFFLESIISLIDKPTDDRHLQFILQTGIQDGGQWDMVVNVIEKYGIVPKSVMPDSYNAANTNSINNIINWKLREYAKKIRTCGLSNDGLHNLKEDMLKEIYKILTRVYGPIPKTFDFEYTIKKYESIDDTNYNLPINQKLNKVVDKNLTPLSFYEKYVDEKLSDFVSIIHAPQSSKPFNQSYTFEYLNNVIGGKPILHYNLDLNLFKYLVINSLNTNVPVWFGSDVGWYGNMPNGYWDDSSFDLDIFNINFEVNKGDMLTYRISAMTHAMLLTGVDCDLNKLNDLNEFLNNSENVSLNEFNSKVVNLDTRKWKIENSWGEQIGNKGYFVCSDSWFDKFVYQAVIKKDHLIEIFNKLKMSDVLETKPIILEPWDPIGTLAK